MKNIVLCGFMGCGKSTVGRILAERLGMTFVDTDALAEQRAGRTVAEIFAAQGEGAFRSLERSICGELAAQSGYVVAAGGGALLFPENAEALRRTGTVVYLDVSPETVARRLAGDDSRPLLRGTPAEKAEKIRSLLAARKPRYEAVCSFTVPADGAAEEVARQIAEKLLDLNR